GELLEGGGSGGVHVEMQTSDGGAGGAVDGHCHHVRGRGGRGGRVVDQRGRDLGEIVHGSVVAGGRCGDGGGVGAGTRCGPDERLGVEGGGVADDREDHRQQGRGDDGGLQRGLTHL